MTTLGIIFVVAYLVALVVKGRLGILVVAAAAIPFNDSAAVLIGSIPITPFYFGMLLYLPMAYLHGGFPRAGSSLPWILGAWAIALTLVGPAVFSGMPVVASGVGIDQQVGRLSELDYSTSNLAQVAYLVFNLAFLMALVTTDDRKQWIPVIPPVIGTAVAMTAWVFRQLSIEWPVELFRNNVANAYAYVETPRLTAQFSEASHLGGFAATSAIMLITLFLVRNFGIIAGIGLVSTAAADVLLVIESGSATALVGVAIFGCVLVVWTVGRVLFGGHKISQRVAVASLLAICVLLSLTPLLIDYAQNIIQYKLDRGASIRSRTSADLTSWQIFLDSGTLGIGLGSNRSSSLLLLLLSTVGLIGTLLFLLLMGRATRDGIRRRQSWPWVAGLVVLLGSAFFSFADLVSPMMWLLAGFCWDSSRDRTTESVSVNLPSGRYGESATDGYLDRSTAVLPKPKVA